MRIVLCFLLALVAAPAWAEWVVVAENDKVVFYIDPARIRKDGNFRKVWQITDMKQPGWGSFRTLYEYDCKEERLRTLSSSAHSGPMAGGQTLSFYDDPGKWRAIPPNSLDDTHLNLVCAK